jgi:hypothetical protein
LLDAKDAANCIAPVFADSECESGRGAMCERRRNFIASTAGISTALASQSHDQKHK